jgi:hypothetical protein
MPLLLNKIRRNKKRTENHSWSVLDIKVIEDRPYCVTTWATTISFCFSNSHCHRRIDRCYCKQCKNFCFFLFVHRRNNICFLIHCFLTGAVKEENILKYISFQPIKVHMFVFYDAKQVNLLFVGKKQRQNISHRTKNLFNQITQNTMFKKW